MIMKQDFIDAVNRNDLSMVRIKLSNEILADPRCHTFNEMLKYAQQQLTGLFETNEEPFQIAPNDKSLWNMDILLSAKNRVDDNFSKEKVTAFKEIAQVVLKEKIEALNKRDSELKQEQRQSDCQSADSSNAHNESKTPVDSTGAAVAIAGTVTAVVGVCLGKTLLAAFGGAVALGGLIMIATSNKK